jgi:uncharacterized protein YndB with AHSA1/START domain
MTLRIIIIIIFPISAVLMFAATKPNTLRVQRSTLVDASPQKIFAFTDDFHNWSHWSPQDKGDSTTIRTYSGRATGIGAVSEWHSRSSAGKGRMVITASVPATNISIKVDFVKPFEAHNVNEFTLEPIGTLTKVTWDMQGTHPYLVKVMSVFVNMDRMMGRHFETGLGNLKAVAERPEPL